MPDGPSSLLRWEG